MLAVGSQVIGWMLIAAALPNLPAVETSMLLLGQPVCAVMWGVLIFGERLSPLQWTGAAIVLAGVVTVIGIGVRTRRQPTPGPSGLYLQPEGEFTNFHL